ncbi:MAG: peptidoglycan-binding protein [Pseudomonadota bacterium]
MNSIRQAIDSIEQRLNTSALGAGQAGVSRPMAAGGHDSRSLHNPGFGMEQHAQATNSQLGMLQEEIQRLSSQIMTPPAAGFQQSGSMSAGTPDLAQQVAARQQMLNNTNTGNRPGFPSGSAGPGESELLTSVIEQLKSLKDEVSGLKTQVEKPVAIKQDVPQSDIDRIAQAVADLHKEPEFNEAAFKQLQQELDSMRGSVVQDMHKAMRREIQASGNRQASNLNARLDALTQGIDSASLSSANSVRPLVDTIASQLDTLRMSVDDLPQTLALSRLEDRLAQMGDQIEGLVGQTQQSSGHESVGGISNQDMASLEGRLDEIARALVAVSNMGNKSPALDLSAVDRVEARMSDLARTIDAIASRDPADELNQLAIRIDGLTERLGSFEKYAENGDLGGASAMFAAPDIGVIEDQLRALNARMDDAVAQSQTHDLEQQVQQLYARLEETAAVNSTAAQMSNLEAQVGQIIRHLNKQGGASNVQVDFSPVEARLGQIEQQIATTQNFSLEAAQQAAQQAVALVGSSSEPGQIIEALSQDLKALQTAAEAGNASTAHTVDQVHATLASVVERLNSIETAVEKSNANSAVREASFVTQPINPMPQAATLDGVAENLSQHANETAFAADGLAEAASADEQLGVMHRVAVETGFVDAPSIDPSDHIESGYGADQTSGEQPPENHQPLEPGSAAPDLEQMVQQANAALKNKTAPGTEAPTPKEPVSDQVSAPHRMTEDVRPDAVAAARRALQATTAEMNSVREEAVKSKTSALAGVKAKAGGLLGNLNMDRLRKPVVMAAAAVLLSLIAFKGYQIFAGGDPAPMAKVEEPVSKQGATEGAVTPSKELANTDAPTTEPEATDVQQVAETPPIGPSDTEQDAASASPPADEVEIAAVPEQPPVATNPTESAPVEANTDQPTVSDVVAEATSDEDQPVEQSARYEVPASAGPAALVTAAATGDDKALFHLGMRYSEGKDVQRNMTESAKWFEAAANQGFAPAQYSIGSLYEKGIGVSRDINTAAAWYEKAAAAGNARAMHNLAVIHAMGNPPEIAADMNKAVDWFKKAANFGIKDSQFNLGILYGQGMGVPQNLIESYKWFALAAKTGDTDASKKRDEVANAMDPDDLDDARLQVGEWKPAKLDDAVNRVTPPREWLGKASGTKTVSAGSQQVMIQKAQAKLNERGFAVGEPDGLMGPKTKNAIMEFQRSAGIPVTGKVDSKLLQALNI